MPVYTYECPKCGAINEEFHTVNDRLNVKCTCGSSMEIVIGKGVMTFKEILPYFDRGMGCYVESRSDRKKKMAARGLREAGDAGDKWNKLAKQIREEDAENSARRKHN